ncbi:MAG TPA: hypothetical protein DCZ23_06620, partial [Lachnospiraceae bacterium]|nr:hypothetical protein [Lachnospiraceae bacterium]
ASPGKSIKSIRTASLNQASTASPGKSITIRTAARAGASVKTAEDGSLVLDFGGQIAVKRVIIKITGTKKTEPLVHIAKVEFVNNMDGRIPAPSLDIPVLSAPKAGNQQIDVSWSAQNNVTGYELYVSGPVKGKTEHDSQIINVTSNKYTITSINNASLLNFEKYTIKVRSVNGSWKSPWSAEVTVIPAPQKKPAPPDNVTATGGYRSLHVSWKNMDDASCYMLYYKKADEAKDKYRPAIAGFEPAKDGASEVKNCITANNYILENLEDETEYSVYVAGWNELGWGSPSLESIGRTKSSNPPELPSYKLLNTSNGEGKVSAHITAASIGGHGGAKMVSSPLDTEAKSALGLADNDYNSYWSKTDWDDGVAYPANDRGMYITLDDEYKMNYITFAAINETAALEYARIRYWNTGTGSQLGAGKVVGARLIRKQDRNQNYFYIVKFDETVTANKLHICFGRGSKRAEMKAGEIRFYKYDSLEDDIMGLYEDEMHTTLKSGVNSDTITTLEARLETPDAESGEKHPLYSELKLEINTAKDILNNKPSPSYEVINQITSKKDGHLGFSGLNSWQPLGKSVYAGETLVVYVGHNTKRTGDSTNLQLVMTQYHAESNSLAKATAALKIGRNDITVPQIADKNFERGGQLYVSYSGNNSSDKYAVRVLGGSDIPVLNLYGKNANDRIFAIEAYINKLENYTKTIETEHNSKHKGGSKSVNYEYDAKNCILNATDIIMEKMMYSLPATQVWQPISGKSDKVNALDVSLKAMEDAMTLFYHHKGLSNDANAKDNGNNALPSQHLNIRYMRMFAGAFMYASGNHIGIEYGSTRTASSATGIGSFGWGIAHEIGHNINQGSYAIAEVTNNYFSQLLTGKERYTWNNVYKKVTSGATDRSSNVFTQLALYWQLHLAFDNNKDDQHVYDSYENQFNNLFFARVDTYSRNPAKAPQSLLNKLDGGADQNIMRLACAAANKNILIFFERWGMVPDDATKAYAAKYGDPYTKALYYVNPDARNYRIDHTGETGTILDQENVVTATAAAESNQVRIDITTNAGTDKDVILGYEIIRSMTDGGKTESQVTGFQPVNTTGDTTTFTDTVSTINNRVMSYTVKAVDKYLNYSKEVPAGQVKIQTDGVLDKSSWTVGTNMISDDDKPLITDSYDPETNDYDPDSGYDEKNPGSVTPKTEHSIDKIIDNNKESAYTGAVPKDAKSGAEITIDMHKVQEVTALKYFGSALSSVQVQVSKDGSNWITVKTGASLSKVPDGDKKGSTIWFDSVKEEERKSWIGTYDARYVKLTTSQTGIISINEIEICGPSGDNLEFMTTEGGKQAIGILKEDYKYGDKAEDIIHAGSLVFTGTYKGNPAYNVVMLYDTKGNVIGAKDGKVEAGQVIFANVPTDGALGETSDGTWVYYIESKQTENNFAELKGTSVRGELYRVDDANTLEGERITSDTLVITIPDSLPEITLTGSKIPDSTVK